MCKNVLITNVGVTASVLIKEPLNTNYKKDKKNNIDMDVGGATK